MGAPPDRIWVPALAALALALVFSGALLARAHGDVSLLVHAGAPCTTEAPSPALPACDATVRFVDESGASAGAHAGARGSLTVQEADRAFDGQFFYRIGVSPWSTDARVAGVQNDLPALRNARWGYGALAWVASGGDPDLVPWSLLGLNVAAAAAVGALGGGLARAAGRHAAWGLLLALWPGFAYSLSLDTSELVASAFVLAGLLALHHRRWIPSAALLTAAVLTRDTTAVVPFGIALTALAATTPLPTPLSNFVSESAPSSRSTHEVPDPHPNFVGEDADSGASAYEVRGGGGGGGGARGAGWGLGVAGVVPLVAFGVWQLVQRGRFGALPLTSSGDNNLTAPFAGLVGQLGAVVPPSGSAEALRLVSMMGLAALLGCAGWLVVRARPVRLDAERIAWLGAVAVVVLLNSYLWSGATAFMRAATEAGLLSIVLVLRFAPRRVLAVAGLGLGGLWLLTAVAQLSKLG